MTMMAVGVQGILALVPLRKNTDMETLQRWRPRSTAQLSIELECILADNLLIRESQIACLSHVPQSQSISS